jgi:hypothetical protein
MRSRDVTRRKSLKRNGWLITLSRRDSHDFHPQPIVRSPDGVTLL